jgi:hypothetical protein
LRTTGPGYVDERVEERVDVDEAVGPPARGSA